MTRRPAMFIEGSAWEVMAGDETYDALPLEPGGVRFYRVEWNDAEDFTAGRIVLPARQADSIRPNILMDLPNEYDGRVAVSIIYLSDDLGVSRNGMVVPIAISPSCQHPLMSLATWVGCGRLLN